MAFCAMLQRTLDFEQPALQQPEQIAQATSLPPPVSDSSARLQLVRPDRQLTFGGAPHWEWPAPDNDRDRIAVDRIREDIDGPSHRFVIERGDRVEAYLGNGRFELGTVTDISHRNQEVRVSHREGSDGLWYDKECIYPAPDEAQDQQQVGQPLSQVIVSTNHEPPDGFADEDRVPLPVAFVPYKLDDYKKFRREFAAGSLAYAEYQSQFARLCQSKDTLVSELKSRFKAPELTVRASRMGSWDAKRSTKDENAKAIYRSMLASFVLDGTVSYSVGERYEDAVAKKVHAVTLEDYVAAFATRQAAAEERTKALREPETYFEFRTFLQEKNEDDLTDEQLARYDALHADIARERRAAEAKTTVAQFQSEELSGYEFVIKEGFHERRQCPLWIVELESRVERSTFNELNIKAKMLGGWYSSFKKADAGFQFTTKDQADRFASLLTGDADRTDVLEARKERKEQTTSERLHDLAVTLATRAEEAIRESNESLQNTARRADIQAGVRGRAYADQALARTMHSIAEALSRGEAQYLDGVRHKTHIETLGSILYLAKWARIRAVKREVGESTTAHGHLIDDAEGQPVSAADIRFVEYPYPTIYKRHLEAAIAACRTAKGARMASERMAKRVRRETEDYITFKEPHDIEELEDYLCRARGAGYNTERMDWSLEKYRRMQRAGIHDIHELRSALREYLPHLAEKRGDDPVKVAERELIGKKLPGFFPTPAPVIERMLEAAEILPDNTVLEPSCGKGDIMDAIKGCHPEAKICAIEQNRSLADVLSAKGHNVEFADFLSHRGTYDRIVMNPPFENGQDIDHVRHAFDLLAPLGRLVSVMSEGPFFRQDAKAISFRDWLIELDSTCEQLPDDAFSDRNAFRQTDVKTRLVVINKLVTFSSQND